MIVSAISPSGSPPPASSAGSRCRHRPSRSAPRPSPGCGERTGRCPPSRRGRAPPSSPSPMPHANGNSTNAWYDRSLLKLRPRIHCRSERGQGDAAEDEEADVALPDVGPAKAEVAEGLDRLRPDDRACGLDGGTTAVVSPSIIGIVVESPRAVRGGGGGGVGPRRHAEITKVDPLFLFETETFVRLGPESVKQPSPTNPRDMPRARCSSCSNRARVWVREAGLDHPRVARVGTRRRTRRPWRIWSNANLWEPRDGAGSAWRGASSAGDNAAAIVYRAAAILADLRRR